MAVHQTPLVFQGAEECPQRKARERDLRARALPTEQTAVPTDEEAAARKAKAARLVDRVLKDMNAKLAESEAARETAAKTAQESYARFRIKDDK